MYNLSWPPRSRLSPPPTTTNPQKTALPYLACLLTRPVSRIRRMYLATTALPLVFAVSALATCLAPTSEVRQYIRV